MKRQILTAIMLFSLLFLTSCSYSVKRFSQELYYSDPQTLGLTWTVSFDNGDTFHGARCNYWGTTDDTSVWELPDGRKLIQSGTVHAVSEKGSSE